MTTNTPVPADLVEAVAKAYADETEYYIQFHRGLSSPSSDKIRKGMRAAIAAYKAHMASDGVIQADRQAFVDYEALRGASLAPSLVEEILRGDHDKLARLQFFAAYRRAAAALRARHNIDAEGV